MLKKHRKKHTLWQSDSMWGGVWLEYKGANGAQVKPIRAEPPITVKGNKFRQTVWMICLLLLDIYLLLFMEMRRL